MRVMTLSRRRTGVALRVLLLVAGGLLLAPAAASAQTPPPPGNCIQDVWKAHGNNSNLNCTAQDVTLSSAKNIHIINGGEDVTVNGQLLHRCFAGQMVTFTADFEMDLTADTRYDTGFYIATDNDPNGDGARTGQCSAIASRTTNTSAANFINLDASPDVCGDITGAGGTAHNPLFVTATINAQCPNLSGQQLKLPFCTTWRQPGSNQVCLGTGTGPASNDVYPGSPSKCNCGTLSIDIFSVQTSITVTKDYTGQGVLETGGSATFNVNVKNASAVAVTITSLTDDLYGDITQVGGDVTATTCTADNVASTCEVGGSIAANGECSCTFTANVAAGDYPGKVTDTVQACANNPTSPTPKCATDPADVPYIDVPQPPSLSKTVGNKQCQIDVTYNVVVTNGSAQDALTVKTLNDNVFGDITQVQGNVRSTTCGQAAPAGAGALPFIVAASGNYSCSFVGRTTSCNQTVVDTVTATTTDDDGANYSPTGQATVIVSVTVPTP